MHPKSTSQKLKPKNFIFLISLTTTEWVRSLTSSLWQVKGFSFSKRCVVLLSGNALPRGSEGGHTLLLVKSVRHKWVWHLKNRKSCWSGAQVLKPRFGTTNRAF
jgi:hypothetical protein